MSVVSGRVVAMGKNNQQRRQAKQRARKARPSRSAHDHPRNSDAARTGEAPSFVHLLKDAQTRPDPKDVIWSAVQALDHGRTVDFGNAVSDVESIGAEPAGRSEVDAAARTMLHSWVARMWQAGWQPADLHRIVQRRLGSSAQALARDAVVDQLSSYAAVTLDPRWEAQLRDTEARAWWPAAHTYLTSRTEQGASLREVVTDVVHVLRLLAVLPELEVLGPTPGTATAADRRQLKVTGADARILSKVRALLAKAESTTFEAEAEAFTEGAQRLMARHSIDAALLAASRDQRADRPTARRIGVDNPYESPKASLLHQIASANRCKAVWTKDFGHCTVVGHAADLDAVETLFTSLLVQATRAMSAQGSRTDHEGRSRTRSFRQSFLDSFALRIGERLTDVTDDETDTVAAAGSSNGKELVAVLSARSAEVDAAVEEMFPHMRAHRPRGTYDGEGWRSGRAAADTAHLGGRPIERAEPG